MAVTKTSVKFILESLVEVVCLQTKVMAPTWGILVVATFGFFHGAYIWYFQR